MKRVCLALLLAALLLLSACTSPKEPGATPATPDQAGTTVYETTEEPSEDIMLTAIDHCAVEPDESAVMTDRDRAQYRRLMDALLCRADSLELDLDEQRVDFLLELLRESPYAFFAADVDRQGTRVGFTYAYSAEEQQRMLALTDGALLEIVNSDVSPDDNELDTILKIYAAVCSRIDYDAQREDNKQLGSPLFDYPADEVYKTLRDHKGLCYGFAYVLRFALLQRGIDAFCVYGECRAHDMGHEWVIVRYDGVFFHCDPAWDRAPGEGGKLMHFGKTDREREADTLVPRDFAKYHLPAYGEVSCSDERFSIFRGVVRFSWLGGHRYQLEKRDGRTVIFRSDTFTTE